MGTAENRQAVNVYVQFNNRWQLKPGIFYNSKIKYSLEAIRDAIPTRTGSLFPHRCEFYLIRRAYSMDITQQSSMVSWDIHWREVCAKKIEQPLSLCVGKSILSYKLS